MSAVDDTATRCIVSPSDRVAAGSEADVRLNTNNGSSLREGNIKKSPKLFECRLQEKA